MSSYDDFKNIQPLSIKKKNSNYLVLSIPKDLLCKIVVNLKWINTWEPTGSFCFKVDNLQHCFSSFHAN